MPSRFFRLVKVIWTLGRYDAILPKEFQSALPPVARFFAGLLRIGAKTEGELGTRFSTALEKLGAVWIKLGQILATRPDIVGIAHANALAGLKDKVAPFEKAVALQILADDFTGGDISKLDEIFGEIGEVVAAASVAQVYKITTKEGKELALKILRPNIANQIKRDIDALMLGAKITETLFPHLRRLKPIALVETVRDALEKETDLRREAGSADAFAQIAQLDGYIEIPKVDWRFNAKNVLATEWIEGKSLTNAEALTGQNREELALKVNRSFLTAALEHGYFHADLHEGNLILGNDGKLYAVDFGIMGRLSDKSRRYFAEILYRFIKRDYRGAARVHFVAGYVPPQYDEGELGIALRAVCEPIWGRKAKDVSMGRVLLQLFDVTEQFGMELRPELVLLQKTMVQVEGVARAINPDHDIWKAAEPIVERMMKREFGPEGITERTIEHLSELATAIMKLPELIAKLEQLVERNNH